MVSIRDLLLTGVPTEQRNWSIIGDQNRAEQHPMPILPVGFPTAASRNPRSAADCYISIALVTLKLSASTIAVLNETLFTSLNHMRAAARRPPQSAPPAVYAKFNHRAIKAQMRHR